LLQELSKEQVQLTDENQANTISP